MQNKENGKASFVIPTRNEQDSIQKTIEAGFNCSAIDEVLVIDGESEDKTYQLAEDAGAKVITQPGNGKGDAIRTGLKHVKNSIAVFMDADILNIQPEMIGKLVESVEKGADFVISDFDREGGRVTELTAKPMFEKFFPEIDVNQPLTGEFAGKTELLKKTPVRNGWGAQVDILIPNWINKDIDSREKFIGFKDHDRKDLFELTEMAQGVATAILEQAWKFGRVKTIDGDIKKLKKAEENETTLNKEKSIESIDQDNSFK